MKTENSELLRRYVSEKSEPAFTELVQRNIDLVYSAALRQVGGDVSAAQDVTQAVFSDLASKALRLVRHSSLTGWLYTSTRYLAAKVRRAEHRRRTREQQAHAMNQLLQTSSPDPDWESLRPVLDDVMHELSGTDREAVLMRYFEGRPLAEIGARLGVTENAARMRVGRALDKLRIALAKRGVTSSATALAAILIQRAVGAAPPGLTAQVSRQAFAAGTAAGGMLAGLVGWLAAAKAQLTIAAGVVALLTAAALVFSQRSPGNIMTNRATTALPRETVNPPTPAAPELATSLAESEGLALPASGTNQLVLNIVTADSGTPIPNVRVDCWIYEGRKITHGNPLQATRFGVCAIPLPRATLTQLVLVSQSDGFADTRLDWHADRGEQVPAQYTLRVARSVPIGGLVIDADGQPVAGAQVGFNSQVDPSLEKRPQTDIFAWPLWVTAVTDTEGRWRIDRFGKQAIRTIYGGASHPEHIGSESVWPGRDPKAEKQLLEGTYVFHLGRPVVASGFVLDPQGQPLLGAKVFIGPVGTSRGEATTQDDGSFSFPICTPGKNLVTAEAKAFAPTTLQVELAKDSPPIRLTLQPGHLLRLRVVNKAGLPVSGASVWLNPYARGGVDSPSPTQVEFNRKTGEDGRLEWDSAPDEELTFGISAAGYMGQDGKARPNGQEHVVTLQSALTISGTVRDASSGQPIPRFHIATGWPTPDSDRGVTNGTWSTLPRFWLGFEGGKFRHVYEEPVLGGIRDPEFMFKVEADGYAPFVTRVVNADEQQVAFEITLRPTAAKTISVLYEDGRPAAKIDVGLVSPTAGLKLAPGGFSHDSNPSPGSLLLTDQQGQFSLPADEAITRVIAACPQGYAEVSRASLADDPTIQLHPWGRLQCTYLCGGHPVAGCELLFEYGDGDWHCLSTSGGFQLKTDADGQFVFPQVPPGKHGLIELVQQRNAQGNVSELRPILGLEIRSGKTTKITASVCRTAARLRWPADLERQPNWFMSVRLQAALPDPPEEAKTNSEALAAWRALPEIKAAAAKAQRFWFREAPDGAFVAEEVPAGRYVLIADAFEPSLGGQTSKTRAHAELPVSVPVYPPSDPLELGEVNLEPLR